MTEKALRHERKELSSSPAWGLAAAADLKYRSLLPLFVEASVRKQLMAVEDIDREEAILLSFAHLCLFASNLKNLLGRVGPGN